MAITSSAAKGEGKGKSQNWGPSTFLMAITSSAAKGKGWGYG